MANATEPTLAAEVDQALHTLKRRRAFKEASVIILLIVAGALLLGLTAIMYQQPLETLQPAGQSPKP